MALVADFVNPAVTPPSGSIAGAAQDALGLGSEPDNDGEPDIDVEAIKETPPRLSHSRNTSEPRPFGEIIDEPAPGSPSLRHPRGRLENKDKETYAEAVKEHAAESSPLAHGNGVMNGHGRGLPASRDKTPETFAGVGIDEEPKSPARRVHKRVSSRSMNASNAAAHNPTTPPKVLRIVETGSEQVNGAAPPQTGGEDVKSGSMAAESETKLEQEVVANNTHSEVAKKEPKSTTPEVSHDTNAKDMKPEPIASEPEPQRQQEGANHAHAGVVKKEPEPEHLHGVPSDDVGDRHAAVAVEEHERNTESVKNVHAEVATKELEPEPELLHGVPSDDVDDGRTAVATQKHERKTSEYSNGSNEDVKPGSLVYDNFLNKCGENLASIKQFEGYVNSLQQQQNKRTTNTKPPQADPRANTELVSGKRVGAGWSTSAIRWAPMNVPLQRRLQTAVVLMHTLCIVVLAAFFFMLCAIPLLWPILFPYLIYILMSKAPTNGDLKWRSERLRNSKIWSLFGSYYPAQLHRSVPLEPTRKYIFGYHPHGIISHGAFIAFSTEALGFAQLFPGITNTLLTLDTNFRIPLYRDYALRLGLASVSRESCENLLTKGGPNAEGMGRAITIVVGGARESLDAVPYSLRLVLARRKGFVKLAIRTGADLVPVLSFGENDLYDQVDSLEHPYIHKAQLLVKKFMGFTVPLFHARGVFNYDVGIMPYRRPINVVVGRPIPIMQQKTPEAAYVDEMHERYVTELVRIWDDWKETFAPHREGELQIME